MAASSRPLHDKLCDLIARAVTLQQNTPDIWSDFPPSYTFDNLRTEIVALLAIQSDTSSATVILPNSNQVFQHAYEQLHKFKEFCHDPQAVPKMASDQQKQAFQVTYFFICLHLFAGAPA